MDIIWFALIWFDKQYISLVADESDSLALGAPAVHRETGTLRILGTSVTQIAAVKDAAKSDLGIKLDFITLGWSCCSTAQRSPAS